MPYISAKLREEIDILCDELIFYTNNTLARLKQENKAKGVANYLITRLVLGLLKPSDGWNYSSLADVIGTLEAAKLEVYRRLVAPYEDDAIRKNGDLVEYPSVEKSHSHNMW